MLYGEKPIEVYKESFVIGSAIEASLSFILVYFLLRIYYCCWPIVVYVLLPISLPSMPHKLLYAAIITILDTNAKQLVKFLNLKRANP